MLFKNTHKLLEHYIDWDMVPIIYSGFVTSLFTVGNIHILQNVRKYIRI